MLGSFFKGKRVFVTGHTGFKGAWLSSWLLKLGANVYGYSDRVPTKPSLFEQLGLAGEMKSEFGDIRDPQKLTSSLQSAKAEIFFHLAAQSLVRPSYADPVETFAVNTMGTVNALEASRKCSSLESVVVVTSDKCYQNNETGRAFQEGDPMGGDDPYSASKGAAEIVLHSYFKSFFAKSSSRLVSVRAGNVIGGGDWAQDRIVPDAIRAWSIGEKLRIRSPNSIRPWQHVLEPLHGYLLAAIDSSANGRAYNFGPALEIDRTVLQVIEALAKSCDFAKGWLIDSSAVGEKSEAKVLKVDPTRAQRELNWRSLLTFEQAVEWTGLWYQQAQLESKNIRELTLHQVDRFEQMMARSKAQ